MYTHICMFKRISMFICLCCEICIFTSFVVFPHKNCPPAFTETAIHDPVVAYVASFQNCLRDWNRDEKGPSVWAPFFFPHGRPLHSFFIFFLGKCSNVCGQREHSICSPTALHPPPQAAAWLHYALPSLIEIPLLSPHTAFYLVTDLPSEPI